MPMTKWSPSVELKTRKVAGHYERLWHCPMLTSESLSFVSLSGSGVCQSARVKIVPTIALRTRSDSELGETVVERLYFDLGANIYLLNVPIS